MDAPTPEIIKPKSGADDRAASTVKTAPGPVEHNIDAQKLDLQVSLKNLPRPLARAIVNFAKAPKPESRLKIIWQTIFKDLLPALTPVATVFISIVALMYTNQQRDRAAATAAIASAAEERKTLAEIIDKFGITVVPDPAKPSDQYARQLEIAAMKFATYGDQVLPAVRMALGARDDGLRNGGELVAQEMYRAKTVEPGKLTGEILSYYRANDPLLQLGVLEWLVKMDGELSEDDLKRAYNMLKESFGAQGQECAKQENHVAMEAANLLQIWSLQDSKGLLSGMANRCPSPDVRRQAQQALDNIN